MEGSPHDTPPTTPTTGDDVRFEVIRQEHTQTFDSASNPIEYWRVTFKTTDGTESFIQVPDADYTPDKVAALIRARVEKIEQVAALGKP